MVPWGKVGVIGSRMPRIYLVQVSQRFLSELQVFQDTQKSWK